MNNKTCCFTGHRNIPAADCLKIQKRLEEEIINLIHQCVTEFRAGGALGFDTLAALAVIKLKPAFPNIRLFLILPYKGQAKGRSETDKKIYNQILSHADKVVYTSEYYYSGCMHKRNRALVYGAHLCLCYLNKTTGGTAYTVNHARRHGLEIINLA